MKVTCVQNRVIIFFVWLEQQQLLLLQQQLSKIKIEKK